MLNCKSVNPRWIFIILMLILSIIIFNNNIVKTYCEEEYQIAECPNNLYLDSYYLTAENSENAIKAVENILIENNLELNDYEIIIDKNIIKIIEKENKETEKTKKTETEIQETTEEKKTEETTTTQENNLEIKNESVEFNDNNNAPEKSITNGFQIVECPESLAELKEKYIREIPKNYNDLFEKVKAKIIETGKNAEDYEIQVKWGNEILTEERYNEIVDYYLITYIKVYIYDKQQTGETTETTTEEGGTISNQDIKDFKGIGICICTLLAISILYNFTSALFRRI